MRPLAVSAALVALAALAACGSRPAAVDVRDYPPQMQANYRIFETRCSRCHGLERPINARVAEGGWDTYVRRMARHPGAGIGPADQRAIAAFLEYHHHRREQTP